MSNALSFKTELYIILSTAYYNLTSGLLLIFLGLMLPDSQWYRPVYFIIGLVIMSYPFFHLRDRLKDRKINATG